ncbi:hypothetical protein Ancab_018095 [Ancistrocladus abbreviatus]
MEGVLAIVICSMFLAATTSPAMAATSAMHTSTAVLTCVDLSGREDFKKIQDAIDSVPSNSELVFIWIKPGIYKYIDISPPMLLCYM